MQKILNLKHAWEFVMDPDVIASKTDYYILCHIAKLVNEGFYSEGGRIRGVPVTIGGSSYIPPLPIELDVKESITRIVSEGGEPVKVAIQLCLYCIKTQIFNDGNKRAAVIFANHYMISHAAGLLVIPERDVPEFKSLLVAYYEERGAGRIEEFMIDRCWRKMQANTQDVILFQTPSNDARNLFSDGLYRIEKSINKKSVSNCLLM